MFRYILAADTGDAPCVEDGLLTLATCKPQIRRSARAGDWVAGFMPRPHDRGLLIYAGEVAASMEWCDYEPAYRGRRDAAYRIDDDGAVSRLRPDYHDCHDLVRKDLSAPVLVFREDLFWYFGAKPEALPENLMHLAAGGRACRVNGADERDIAMVERWLRKRWPVGVRDAARPQQTCSPCG